MKQSKLKLNWSFQKNKKPGWWLSIPTPLKNMSSSDGIIIPNIWKIQVNYKYFKPYPSEKY